MNGVPWTASVVEQRDLASMLPYVRNARTHSDEQVEQLVAAVLAFGFTNPILVDERGEIIAGHGRVLAAARVGMTAIPTITRPGLSESEKRALRLADNQIALNAGWDDALLAVEIARIREEGEIDLPLLGFADAELDRLLALHNEDGTPEPDPADDVPEGPAVAVSRLGDLWLCGEHRVLCGDATSRADVERVLGGEQAAMCFTDPPYNVDYEGKTQQRLTIENDALGAGFGAFLRDAMGNILAVTDGGCYICMGSSELHRLRAAWDAAGGHWSTFIVWAKNTFTLGRSDFQRQYEPILYGWREGTERYWCGARDQGDVWLCDRPTRNDLHPTMKPVALVERAIRNSSEHRGLVLDPFGGSGTTLIAAERTGRRAALVELDPRYVDVIVRRWEAATRRRAVLEATGERMQAVASARRGEAAPCAS
jgi:DNA modification methylase